MLKALSVIPAFLLKKLYVPKSLKNIPNGFELSLKNTLTNGTLVGFGPVFLDGNAIPLERVTLEVDGASVRPTEISTHAPRPFALNRAVTIRVAPAALNAGKHALALTVDTKEAGALRIQVEDMLQ